MAEVEECSFRNEVSVFCSWDVKTIRVEKKRADCGVNPHRDGGFTPDFTCW